MHMILFINIHLPRLVFCNYVGICLSVDSDSEEEEQFYSANESARRKKSLPSPDHALSVLCLTVLIGKGRVQAMTDSKVSQSAFPVSTLQCRWRMFLENMQTLLLEMYVKEC